VARVSNFIHAQRPRIVWLGCIEIAHSPQQRHGIVIKDDDVSVPLIHEASEVVHQFPKLVVVAVNVEHANRLVVDAQLQPRRDFEQLLLRGGGMNTKLRKGHAQVTRTNEGPVCKKTAWVRGAFTPPSCPVHLAGQ